MLDEQTPAPEAGDEGVAEAVEVTTDDVTEETPDTGEQGQDKDQPAEGEASDDAESEETKSRSQARRERRKAETERLRTAADDAKRELSEANEKLARMNDAIQNSQPPQQGENETYEDYQAKLSAFYSLRMFDERNIAETRDSADRQQRQADTLAQQHQAEAHSMFADACVEARERYADFDAVTKSPTLQISEPMAEIVLGLDKSADVYYELGKDPTRAAQIAQMPPLQAAVEIGRIEAGLAKPKPITTSQAPTPITPVRGAGVVSKDPSKMSTAEYRKWRESGGTPK